MSIEAVSPKTAPDDAAHDSDAAYQEVILQGVSRTFALTIPELSEDLRRVVGNAYLLCRIADTIEDSDTLTFEEKKRAYAEFIAVAAGTAPADTFARTWGERLSGKTLAAERDLVRNTPRVVRLTHSFSKRDQAALLRCIRIMSDGMEQFQEGRYVNGLPDVTHLDSYCYHVAGVVGEMLTELFCAHSPAIAQRYDELSKLAVSFGQGLQMTNILKDIWDDRERGACWLPQDVFLAHGIDLAHLPVQDNLTAFESGLQELISLARSHLDNALAYTLLIPKEEAGVRRFCLWAIGMAVLTLRKINVNRTFRSSAEVKISRRSVKATIALTQLFGWSNRLLRLAYRTVSRGLPAAPVGSLAARSR